MALFDSKILSQSTKGTSPGHHQHGEGCGHSCGHDHSHAPPSKHENKHADGCCGHEHHDHSDCGHEHSHEVGSAAKSVFFHLELIALILWGVGLLYFITSGRVVKFLAPTGIFREQALIGGLLLLVLAIFNFAMRRRTTACGHDHGPGESHHHHDEPGAGSKLATLLLLLGPVGYALAKSPNQYSEQFQIAMANSRSATVASASAAGMQLAKKNGIGAAATGGEYTLEIFRKQMGISPDGPLPMEVFMLWAQAGDPTMRKILDGQPVEITGRVIKNTINGPGKRLRLFDLQMTCCAGDARPVSFPIVFEGELPDYREMGWHKISGTIGFEQERGGMTSVVKVTSMEPTSRPAGMGGNVL